MATFAVIIFRIILTLGVLLFGFYTLKGIWTKNWDISKTFSYFVDQIPEAKVAHGFQHRTVYITRVSGPKYDRDKLVILFPYVAVVNNSDKPITMKKVSMAYNFRGETRSVDSRMIPVTVDDGDFKNVNTIVLLGPVDNFVLTQWVNLQEEFSKNELKPPGSIWWGSIAFIFPEKAEQFSEMSGFQLCLEDYSDQKTVIPFQFNAKETALSPGCSYRMGKYRSSANNEFDWLKEWD